MALEIYLSNPNEDVDGDRKLMLSLKAKMEAKDEEEALKEYNLQMLADGLHPYVPNDSKKKLELEITDPFFHTDIFQHGVFSIELFKSANASDYQPFLRVIEEWSDKKLCSVWLSDSLPADLNLPMDTKTPDCKLVQMFVLCEDEPSILLSVYQTDADPQAREKEIMEFTAKTARQLTFFLHRYCYCDFLILPCTKSQSSFTVEGIAKEVKEQQDFSRSYYFGPEQLTTDDYEKLRKAATVLSSTSYVPCFLSKAKVSEHFDSVSETQTEDWLLLLDSDWRKLLSLLVENISRGKDGLYLTYTKRSKDKLTAAAIEAARRLSFQNELEIVTDDSTIQSCVQKLVNQTEREFKGSVRLKIKLRDVQLTSKPSVPSAHHLEPSTESAATPSEREIQSCPSRVMASASPSRHVSVTDCPRCRCLCVGPTILPCGHVLCRRCLRQLLEQQGPDPTCSSCGHSIPRGQGQTISEQLDQFCKDLVLQEIVADHIFKRSDSSCQTCCKPAWTNVCLDCGTFYCIHCSENHRTEHAADCHTVVDPRQVLISASSTTSRPPGHEDVSQTSTSLLEFQRQEVKLLEEKHSDHGRVESDLDEFIAKLQNGRDRVRDQKHLLHMYTTRMPTTINTTSRRERLRRVREDISLSTREMLQDLRRETDRLVALWMEPVEVQVWKSSDDHGATPGVKGTTECVMVTPKSTTISLDSGSVCVEQISDDVIHQTVKDVVIAKINWSENLARVQRQPEAEKVKGQQQLQAEKRRAEAKLAALYDTHQEEKKRERERVETFYTGIQQKKTSLLKQVMKRIDEKDVLSKLVQQLCEEFDVRLLAIDSGLRFLMDVPVEEWKAVKELQEKLQKVLEDTLLPKEEKKAVTWTEVTSCSTETGDSDVRLGQPLPTHVTTDAQTPGEPDSCGNEHQQTVTEDTTGSAKDTMLQKQQGKEVTSTEVTSCSTEAGGAEVRLGQPLPTHVTTDSQTQKETYATGNTSRQIVTTGGVSFDPMTATPHRVFLFTPHSDDDTDSTGLYITSIVATQDGQRLVMTDLNNKMVKVADVTNPHTVLSVTLDDKPRRLALLQDGRVAVTAWNKRLYLLDVSGHPTVVWRVQTARQYFGVSAGTTDGTLIVSCIDVPVSVDVITYEGKFIHTVVDNNTLIDLKWPQYLNTVGGDLFVSDYDCNTVFRVELATGRVVVRLTHPDMKGPHQVCADPSGNVYIACRDSECVLVMSADGRWRRLLEGSQHGDEPCVRPVAVCVTDSRLVVSWHELYGYSVVARYEYDVKKRRSSLCRSLKK